MLWMRLLRPSLTASVIRSFHQGDDVLKILLEHAGDFLHQGAMLCGPHPVDPVVEMLEDVKPLEDEGGVGNLHHLKDPAPVDIAEAGDVAVMRSKALFIHAQPGKFFRVFLVHFWSFSHHSSEFFH